MRVVTLGEIMLRLSTPGYQRFVQSQSFDVNYGGGEANVAVSISNYGGEGVFVTKLPENDIGQCAINSLRQYGVDTKNIVRGGERVGIYYLETGDSMRASKVVYDRAHSSISEAKADEFDWDAIFKDADWFHVSGITPALSKSAQELTKVALMEAKKRGVTTSFDLNYRAKLWTKAEAQACLIPLMEYVDYSIGNEEDAESCLGFKSGSDVNSGKLDVTGYEKMLKALCEAFHFKGAVASLRESHSANDNGWSGVFYSNGAFHQSRHYEIRIVDRVGGGDSFAAGLIYGLLAYKDDQKAIEFAAAASALKHTIPGDFNHVGVKEVEALMGGATNGRVQR